MAVCISNFACTWALSLVSLSHCCMLEVFCSFWKRKNYCNLCTINYLAFLYSFPNAFPIRQGIFIKLKITFMGALIAKIVSHKFPEIQIISVVYRNKKRKLPVFTLTLGFSIYSVLFFHV